jgi:hypothetical protein
MQLLETGRATAAEVAELSGLPLQRVQRWIDHDARGVWLAKQWNREMQKLIVDESMGHIRSHRLVMALA